MNNEEQVNSLTRELDLMRERYLKLVDIHGQLQRENSLLEERVLSVVETYSDEKSQLEQDLIDSKQQIIHLQETVQELEFEKQRYKDDCNLAVRLLHRHPNEFISTAATSSSLQEQSKNKNEPTSRNQSVQSQHTLLMPTFPPTFVTSIPLLNTNTAPLPNIPVTVDNLRLAESLFESNAVHRYPSSHFICSNCHETVKRCDVSVQTTLEDSDSTSRTRVVSLTASDDGLNSQMTRISIEPHHAHMTVQEYQMGYARRTSQETPLPSTSIPQMHHV